MYICLCNAVTDSDIAEAVQNGATDLSQLQNTLGVSTGCGTCQDAALEIISSALSNAAEHLSHAA